jgi:tetratricopeptide (TPR) repeat protein
MLGEDDPNTLGSMNNLGTALLLQERYDDAEALYRVVVQKRRKVLGEKHLHTLGSIASLARVYELKQRYADAVTLLAPLTRPQTLEVFPPQQQAIVVQRYAVCLVRLNRLDEAEPALLDAERRLRDDAPARTAEMKIVLTELATLMDKSGRSDEAARRRGQLAELDAPTRPTTQPAGPLR